MLIHFFAVLIVVQFVVVVSHDYIEIPGWSHARQVRTAIGPRKLLLATIINAVFPGIAAGLAIWFWGQPAPVFARNYWLVYCGITVASAIAMWWMPYGFGTKPETKRLYAAMYAGTRQWLPARGDNPRPNVLHLCFHTLFVLTFVLAAMLRFRGASGR